MFDILRDPMWQFVAVIIAILAILISCFLYWKQRRNKALSYEILSRTPLLSVKEEVKGKLQILFDKKPVQQVHLVEIRLGNSGNVPILANDFERPVSLSFGEEGQILSASIVETNPDSLRASIVSDGKKVVLMPTLLNQGDSIKLKMLVSKFKNQIAVDGRIVGVKDIQPSSENPLRYLIPAAIGFFMFLVGVINTTIARAEHPLWLVFLIMLTIGYWVMVIPLMLWRGARRSSEK